MTELLAIAIQGPQKAGKTTTLHQTRDLLLETVDREVKQVCAGQGTKEIKGGILEVDGVLVGFMTKSETVKDLLKMLASLLEWGCQIIVCATHMPGSKSAQHVEDFCQEKGLELVSIMKDKGSHDDREIAECLVR
jgi:hypothetical protein